jgi:hypothetical protein
VEPVETYGDFPLGSTGNLTGKLGSRPHRTIEFISIYGRNSHGSSTGRTRSSPSVGCGATLSLAGASAVAASKTKAASGRWRPRSGAGPLLCPPSCRVRLPPWRPRI